MLRQIGSLGLALVLTAALLAAKNQHGGKGKHTGGPASPVVITSLSLAAGTVGVAYNQTLAATGGTVPLTWSITSGALPPPLALSATTGAITGTPTAAGTYSFVVHVTDSAATPLTYDQGFAIIIASAGGATIFSDTFESGNFAAWDFVWDSTDDTVQSTIKHGGSYAAKFHYYICGDATNPACGAAHQDINRWISKIISPGLTHFFVRGYVYLKSPEAGATPSAIIQRKLFRMSDTPSSGGINSPGTTYEFLVNSWNSVNGALVSYASVALNQGTGVETACCPTGQPNRWDLGSLTYDAWHSLEIEIELNTPGAADGVLRLWVDGTLSATLTDVNYRGNCTNPVTGFFFGNQADRNNFAVVDEYRYWDDIVISTSYIGP